ncbi:MAG: lamin tail domain-containing protein [Candidatus Scalindua sp.]|nr:lamin tail domain-containing protein [Candidatus Scalindua sp.]
MEKTVGYVKNEEGYILIIIVGVFTILSLMAITFATLSRIETKATRNYSDSIKCEAAARAGLEHALYILRQDKFGDDDIAYNSDNGDENYDWSGETWMPGGSDFSGTDYDNDGDGTNDSKWIYFPATVSTNDVRLPGKLRGRYAILITDDREARININVTGNKAGIGNAHTSDEGWSTFEIDLSSVILQVSGTATAITSDIIGTRQGSDLKPGTSTVNDNSGITPDPQTDGVDNDGDWNSAVHDTNNNGIPDSGETNVDEADEAVDEPTEFNPIYPPGDDRPFSLLSEAEIMGTSTFTSRLETICNSRGVSQSDQASLNEWFTTCSADTIVTPPYQLDGGTATTMLNMNFLITNEGAYTDTVTYNSDKKVEMITDMLESGGITGSSGTSGYVERHQLAVNTKDFIDSDTVVTLYSDGTDTYYGIERTPYINEVEAEVNVVTAGGLGKFIELFNPYDTAIDITNWTITGTSMPAVTLNGTINAQDYYVIADDSAAYATFAYEGGTPPDQTDLNINLLTPAGEVLTLADTSGTVQKTHYGQADNTTNTRQLNDPRPTPLTDTDGTPNVNASIPWRWTTSLETAGEENGSFDPAVGGDGWENTTPTWPLSFPAANRIFSNKGYLGFIHTGRQWQSFNVDQFITYPSVLEYLTITDPSMDGIDNDGDGDSDSSDTGSQSGDINGKEYRIPGLINVNTAPSEVLQSLPNIDSTIASAIESSADKPFTGIGDFVADITQITGTGNKWDREKRFRSISNLITTRSNVFTVYVTAQVTNDSETDIFSERKILAIVDRSLDPIKIRYFRWITK